MNELFIRPACTQSSDEVFLTASNQIVNDLRSTHPAFPYRMRLAGLETCSVAQIPESEYLRLEKLFENLKEPTRKAVFRFVRWPARSFVTVPYRGLYIYFTTAMRRWQPPRCFSQLRSPIWRLCQNINSWD